MKTNNIPPNFGHMNAVTPFKQNLLILGFLLGLSSCAPKPAIFRAFSDGTMSWWSLNLCADSSFDMHLGGGDFEGHYRILGDTILLRYTEEGSTAGQRPSAFLIDRAQAVVVSMRWNSGGNRWQPDDVFWMRLLEDGLEWAR